MTVQLTLASTKLQMKQKPPIVLMEMQIWATKNLKRKLKRMSAVEFVTKNV